SKAVSSHRTPRRTAMKPTAITLALLLLAIGSGEAVAQPAKAGKERPLRVLVFAGGPSRDFQFVLNLFARQALAGRATVAARLQDDERDEDQPVVVGGKGVTRLARFPDKFQAGDRSPYNLANYDVLIALDPDWTRLE